jgi:hypothetical protein
VKQAVMFMVVGVALIALCAAVLLLLYEAPADRRAVTISALIAVITQGVAYAIVRGMTQKNVIAGWGLGAMLRLAVLVVFALVIVRHFGLNSAPATISLALFLFVTTLVEPLFLKS